MQHPDHYIIERRGGFAGLKASGPPSMATRWTLTIATYWKRSSTAPNLSPPILAQIATPTSLRAKTRSVARPARFPKA